MRVAPGGITEKDWRALDLLRHDSSDWGKAITIFRKRIEDRFIQPVDTLLESERQLPRTQRRYGFVIMAIDCLLIETLQAFRYGQVNTEGKSRPLITNFLQKSPHFGWTRVVAHQFYDDFRCGILHQAETMRDSLIRSEGPLLIEEASGLIINRTEFHRRLKRAFTDYLQDLKDGWPQSLREKFRVKMEHICRDNPLSKKHPIIEPAA
jgi:hypothetical protein